MVTRPSAGGRRAFTLVELLVVLAVVSLLAGVLGISAQRARAAALRAQCLSHQRQIGQALLLYAHDHGGYFPPTTHTTGSRRRDQSWIYELAPYLGNLEDIRICPADPPARQARIRRLNATSYALNDLVCDHPDHNHLLKIPRPSRTILLFTLSENRPPSATNDHIHGAEWTSWTRALNDIEPDRHRIGARALDRLRGSANYLYADGRVENISAKDFKQLFDQGINPAAVPCD